MKIYTVTVDTVESVITHTFTSLDDASRYIAGEWAPEGSTLVWNINDEESVKRLAEKVTELNEGTFVHFNVHELPDVPTQVLPEILSITAANGVRFNVRILRPGDPYGATFSLLWGAKEDGIVTEHLLGVEFYDARYPHTIYGQFTGGRYYLDDILASHGPAGLDLNGGVASWEIDRATFFFIKQWLHGQSGFDR